MSSGYTIRQRYAGRINHQHHEPRSPCPTCYSDGHSTDTTSLMQFRCPRGHEWTTTRQAALQHAEYCNRSTWTEAR